MEVNSSHKPEEIPAAGDLILTEGGLLQLKAITNPEAMEAIGKLENFVTLETGRMADLVQSPRFPE